MTSPFYQPITDALSSGNLSEAERLSRWQLLTQPDDESLLLLLAISLHKQGYLADAVKSYARLTELFPASGLHFGNYATALRELGMPEESARIYAIARQLAPDDAAILMNFGLLLLQQKDFVQAREILLDAHALDPDSAVIRIHAARVCSMCSDTMAIELVKPWRQWAPLDGPLQLELANVLATLTEAAGAVELLEDLANREPAHFQVQAQLAALFERMNRLDDAASLLKRMDRAYPPPDEFTRREMTRQKAWLTFRKGDVASALQLLEQAGPRDDGDYGYHFVRAEICNKLGDTQETMRALNLAHARQSQELELITPASFTPDAPALAAAITKLTADEYARWPALRSPTMAHSPVFIVGFPRSGTTLLEQMLDAHPGFQSMDEQPFFSILSDRLGGFGVEIPRDLHRLSQRDCDELRKDYWELVCDKVPRNWQAQLVDKNPLNMLWLPMIHRLFPEAKFILALRHPCDVILSCYMQNFHSTPLATACVSLERLTTAYETAMEHWLQHVEVFRPRVLVSRYEDLVTNFQEQTQRLAEFLEVEDAMPLRQFDQHARSKGYIGTPSYAQVIQSVNREGLNRWKSYQGEFEPLLPILQPMLTHWGYASEPND